MADQIIPITRPSVSSPVVPPRMNESKFPTEVINLPSKGWFYPTDNPLSSGTLELKMMTAKEEDILTSKNLIQKNIVLDKLLEAVVVDRNIKLDEMFNCDRNAAFFAIRRLAYGDEYSATLTCTRCGKENNIVIDLGKMDNKEFDFEKYPKGENKFTLSLPNCGKIVTYKILTRKDENSIEQELTGLAKVNKDISREITTRLSNIITSVDGNEERTVIRKFVNEGLPSKDSLVLRKYIRETMPDIDTTFDFTCTHCGNERREETPMGVSFFWPNG
jgi:DNA-directed RNA polymerase subunit M/transcription elongation factor TFIIS